MFPFKICLYFEICSVSINFENLKNSKIEKKTQQKNEKTIGRRKPVVGPSQHHRLVCGAP
jgi:hypothetical protein